MYHKPDKHLHTTLEVDVYNYISKTALDNHLCMKDIIAEAIALHKKKNDIKMVESEHKILSRMFNDAIKYYLETTGTTSIK